MMVLNLKVEVINDEHEDARGSFTNPVTHMAITKLDYMSWTKAM